MNSKVTVIDPSSVGNPNGNASNESASDDGNEACPHSIPLDILLELAIALLRDRQSEINSLRKRNEFLHGVIREMTAGIRPSGTILQ